MVTSAHPESRPARRKLGVLRGEARLPEDVEARDAEIARMFEGESR